VPWQLAIEADHKLEFGCSREAEFAGRAAMRDVVRVLQGTHHILEHFKGTAVASDCQVLADPPER
jgi:hypothetical protein